MKLSNTSKQTQILESENQATTYQIANNSTAFQILSSGLYSNKFSAVLRELSCNAYDAHIAANKKDVPFEVHLPTPSRPLLTIKDQGPGLDHDQVLQLYTTYFNSDKRNSNKAIGGLGLGSKSPFAYTTSFTVVSVHEGTQRTYVCSMPLGEEPKVKLMNTQATTKANGVEVQVPIKTQDIESFVGVAPFVYEHFPVKPLFNIELSPVEKSLKYEAANFCLEQRGYNNRMDPIQRTNIRILMGTVAYPLDISALGLAQTDPAMLVLALANQYVLTIRMPIGSVNVAASREALQYDPSTKKALVQALNQVRLTLAEQILDVLQSNDSHWQKRVKLCHGFDFLRSVLSNPNRWQRYSTPEDELVQVNTWMTGVVNDTNLIRFMHDAIAGRALPGTALLSEHANHRDYVYLSDTVGRKNILDGRYSVGKNTEKYTASILENSAIVVVDEVNAIAKFDEWRTNQKNVNGGKYPEIILCVPSSVKTNLTETLAHAQQLSDHFEGMPVYRLSALAIDTVVKPKKKANAYVPIDDRMVTWCDWEGNVTNRRLGDIPMEERAMLVTNTVATTYDDNYLLNDAELQHILDKKSSPRRTVKVETILTALQKWYAYAKSIHALDKFPFSKGYMEVTPVNVGRMQLQDKQFKMLIPAWVEQYSTNAPFWTEKINQMWLPVSAYLQNQFPHAWIHMQAFVTKEQKQVLHTAWKTTPWHTEMGYALKSLNKQATELMDAWAPMLNLNDCVPAAKTLPRPLVSYEIHQQMIDQYPKLKWINLMMLNEGRIGKMNKPTDELVNSLASMVRSAVE
jgi:hypothetical protein